MYAIIETGGKQVKVAVGETIYIEKLDVAAGEVVSFDKVLLLNNGESKFGNPYVNGAKVLAKIEKHGKTKKIIVFKFKSKTTYRRKKGHRQNYTKVVIEKIEG